jgi:hypothetical protein
LLWPEDERIFAYYRAESLLVVLNFSQDEVVCNQLTDLHGATVIKATESKAVKVEKGVIHIKPYAGAIWAL